jgi:hypothetical protein
MSLGFLTIYLLECAGLYAVYDCIFQLMNTKWKAFREIQPDHKKWYVVSNYIKGGVLGLMVPLYYRILGNDLWGGEWDANYVSHLGCVYACLDMVSILRVPKLARNTIYHHLAVNGLFLYILTNGADGSTFARLIAIYAVFSAFAFPVNLYLSTRVISKNTKFLRACSSVCFVNYIVCCAANWSYQFYNLIWLPHYYQTYGILPVVAFCSMIAVVMWDDIILIRYLKRVSYFRDILEGKKWLDEFTSSISRGSTSKTS